MNVFVLGKKPEITLSKRLESEVHDVNNILMKAESLRVRYWMDESGL